MAEALHLATPAEIFPHSPSTGRRVKIHKPGWRVHQPARGVYLWRSPHGHWHRVDNTGTHRLVQHPDLTAYGITNEAEGQSDTTD